MEFSDFNQTMSDSSVECFRLQPRIDIMPKKVVFCPCCQDRMMLTRQKGENKSDDSDKNILTAYLYRCPGCKKEWSYDLLFRPIFRKDH